MANHIPDVERVSDSMRKGWPFGTGELHRDVPLLLARIQELENALVPFARVAVSERDTAQFNTSGLVHVYLKDCVTAFNQLDTAQGIRKPQDNFFDLPAGG